jgi:hypothetical protein
MKKQHVQLFANLFGAKGRSADQEKTTPVTVTSYSQPHVLQQKMREEKLSHGETVTANLSPVRLESAAGKMVLYFCPMKTIEILQTVTPGDGGSIPAQAIVEGLKAPENCNAGFYSLKNVKITSNGSIQVMATADTTWEMVHPEPFPL